MTCTKMSTCTDFWTSAIWYTQWQKLFISSILGRSCESHSVDRACTLQLNPSKPQHSLTVGLEARGGGSVNSAVYRVSQMQVMVSLEPLCCNVAKEECKDTARAQPWHAERAYVCLCVRDKESFLKGLRGGGVPLLVLYEREATEINQKSQRA